MTTLFLNWQDSESRRWYVVGRLDQPEGPSGPYVFGYTRGVLAALQAGFVPIVSFPDVGRRYESDEMFALFENRLLSHNRPEYADYLRWLSLTPHQATPFAILARSGGTSASDSFELFPDTAPKPDGTYVFHGFIRGLRHQTEAAAERAEDLEPGERLLLMPDLQNPKDPAAVAVRTAEKYRRDMHILGYLPRYLAGELRALDWQALASVNITVAQVNPPPAPSHLRVLVRVALAWPGDARPFRTQDYEHLATAAVTLTR